MKAKTFLVIVFLCGSFGLAQAQSNMMFQGSGGFSIPLTGNIIRTETMDDFISWTNDDMADYYKTGFSIGGGIGYFLDARQRVALQGNIDYTTQPWSEADALRIVRRELEQFDLYLRDDASISGPSLNFWAISVGLRVNPEAYNLKIVPYFIGSVSLVKLSGNGPITAINGLTKVQSSLEIVDTSRFGFAFGVGLSLNLTYRSGIFIEARYNLILGEEMSEPEDLSDEILKRLEQRKNLGLIPLKIGLFVRR